MAIVSGVIVFLTGLLIGFVAGYLAYIFWGLPRAIERAYRQDWLKPGPAAFAEAAKQRN